MIRRPVDNCGHVDSDGTCRHPDAATPECHDECGCPCTPEAIRAKAESDWKAWHEAQSWRNQ